MFKVGDWYSWRDFTGDRYIGRLAEIGDTEFVFSDFAWVADTGRRGKFFSEGMTEEAEIEAMPGTMSTPRAGIVIQTWPFEAVKTK